MCLFDDVFMTTCLAGQNECVEYVLKILLNKDLKVLKAEGQKELPNLHGQTARLDIMAVDENGKQYNIEVQRDNRGAKAKRARRNGSMLDANVKNPGVFGENLPETYIIFITEHDYWHENQALYPVERFVLCGDRYLPFHDQLHILYVNGEWSGEDPVGQLMKDFHCTKSRAMSTSPLKDRVCQIKDDSTGDSVMGTMLDQAELRGEARGEKRGIEKGRAEQRKLDEVELKAKDEQLQNKETQLQAKDDEIAQLKALLKEAQLAKK